MKGPVGRALVVAKAPVPGEVKTRLGAEIGHDAAAALAAAALLDTLDACAAAGLVGHLSLAGDLAGALREDELRSALAGWTVSPQHGAGFAARLVRAHLDAGPGPVVQVGMDTPQLTPALLHAALDGLDTHDVVLGPAPDGGWWALARLDPVAAHPLAGVAMSAPTTYDDTRAALRQAGHRVGETVPLRDVDTVADARAVAAAAQGTRFAWEWAALEARLGTRAGAVAP